MGCSWRCWSHHPGSCLRKGWMWHLVPRFSWHGSHRLDLMISEVFSSLILSHLQRFPTPNFYYLLVDSLSLIRVYVYCILSVAGSVIQATSELLCYTRKCPCISFVFHVKALLTQTDPMAGTLKSYAGVKWQEASKLWSSVQHVEVFSVVSSLKIKVTFTACFSKSWFHLEYKWNLFGPWKSILEPFNYFQWLLLSLIT